MVNRTEQPLSRERGTTARARQMVTAFLAQGGLDELCDTAALVTTELVTNVLVHTECVPTLRILVADDMVRVEVEDACPALPVAGMLDPTAACGRGLVMVEQFSHRWGVTRGRGPGKAVWFELVTGGAAAAEDLSDDELLDLWGDDEDVLSASAPVLSEDGEATGADPSQQLQRVRVEHVPTALLNATKSHLDDLVRELVLVNEAAAEEGSRDEELVGLAARLSHLAADLVGFRNQVRRQALEAVQRGDETLTLELDLPVSMRGRLVDYRRALDEAEEHCVAGRLLVPAEHPEQSQFRRWKLDRILEQLGNTEAGALST